MRISCLALVIAAGCSVQTPPEPERTVPERRVDPPRPAPPRPAPVAKIDLSLGDGYEMRRPVHDGRLTLIPIIATRELPARQFITLQAGMARGVVTVREISEDWEVDHVRVTNRAREPLVVMTGELIVEAMQDRVTAETTVIQPGDSELVSVRCVEEDRDHGNLRFRPGHAIGELSLRRTVVHESQEAVWKQVDAINRRHALAPSTKTYRHAAQLQAKGTNAERRTQIITQLEAREERQRIVGVAVVIDDQVIAIDRFATPELYRQLEPQLIASYLADTEGARGEGRKLSPDAVRALAGMHGSTSEAMFTVLRPL